MSTWAKYSKYMAIRMMRRYERLPDYDHNCNYESVHIIKDVHWNVNNNALDNVTLLGLKLNFPVGPEPGPRLNIRKDVFS